jgi:hypothetical protein
MVFTLVREKTVGRFGHRLNDNIKMCLKEIGCKSALTQNRVSYRGLVRTALHV